MQDSAQQNFNLDSDLSFVRKNNSRQQEGSDRSLQRLQFEKMSSGSSIDFN